MGVAMCALIAGFWKEVSWKIAARQARQLAIYTGWDRCQS